jgi:hypothetical protein
VQPAVPAASSQKVWGEGAVAHQAGQDNATEGMGGWWTTWNLGVGRFRSMAVPFHWPDEVEVAGVRRSTCWLWPVPSLGSLNRAGIQQIAVAPRVGDDLNDGLISLAYRLNHRRRHDDHWRILVPPLLVLPSLLITMTITTMADRSPTPLDFFSLNLFFFSVPVEFAVGRDQRARCPGLLICLCYPIVAWRHIKSRRISSVRAEFEVRVETYKLDRICCPRTS